MKIHPLGKFGGMVKNYEKGRSGYPSEVFAYLKSLVKVKKPLILDLGCGTGIATRQLTKIGRVIGADPDKIMLGAARKYKSPKVMRYVAAQADKLPFKDGTFDAVTAFSAFHWFDDKNSVAEIRRVLKPGGIFFTANRPGVRSWGQGYRKAISKSINIPVAQFVTGQIAAGQPWEPEKIFKKAGFKNIEFKQWKKSENYSFPRALRYVQSVSIWNSVPQHLR